MPTLEWYGSTGLTQQNNSPHYTFAEKVTAVAVYRAPFALCLSSAPRRGMLGTGTFAGLLVESADVAKERGGIGVLTVTYTGKLAGDTQVPVDDCEVDGTQEEFPLEEHPLFDALSSDMKNAVKSYVAAQNDEERQKYDAKIAADATAELLRTKLLRRQEKFVLFPPVYIWTLHYLTQPAATTGGGIETPGGPITPPSGYSWLRCADKLRFTGTYWELTRKWIASFLIDSDIYPV